MKGHGNGAEDIGQRSSKNREREIKDPAVMREPFLALPHRRRRQRSPTYSCVLLDLPLTPRWQNCWGWEDDEHIFCPECELPLYHFDDKCIQIMLKSISK